jgi:DTW domain-containing protein YfiP
VTGAHDHQPARAAPRRALCPRCERAQAACICGWIRPSAGAVELLILQHPLEVANAKGSARLLHLSVAGSVMATGEAFDAARLAQLLHAGGRTPLLLYPTLPEERKLGIAAPPPLPDPMAPASSLRLVVLDATWRKTRKMLYLNPALHAIARLGLDAPPPSHYRIRKAHAPDQLSTLEAACHALASLDHAPARYLPLLAAFDGLVDQLAARMGRERA